ncbi:MAG TPA: tetratricopeptide repeat protein [Spirochaetota bacterium]|nr:tetratricopeptide repeat protein [Spirochaetota bacterium]HPF04615.1 tetratricopeptide repeat protein [Spirochaetota bacterium]HPJ42024.1 tetratricopeptide repeat protein [Spirochaetota bacterium]HPR36184.1 tetratricopeptide repeat protein [Spirochaetota bacterium]HRX46137.1 tetratricopeptide repeat protein [Spirochaetota bacterium]
MKKAVIISFLIMIFLNVSFYTYAEEISGAADVKKAADDMKFVNALGFYKLEKYDRALNEFYEYLEIYYDGIHRSEALRKIAEIHIKNFNYQKAIEAYSRLYQEFSGTEEGLDAYFQAGICYKKMGFDIKAETIFKYILANHPGTSAAYNSEIQLELLRMENE